MYRSGIGGDIYLLECIMVMCLLVRSEGSNCRTSAAANVLVGDGGYDIELEHLSPQSTRVNTRRSRHQLTNQNQGVELHVCLNYNNSCTRDVPPCFNVVCFRVGFVLWFHFGRFLFGWFLFGWLFFGFAVSLALFSTSAAVLLVAE